MNKKEKQAIEVLKNSLLKSDGYERHQKAINTILELVEKQQKEIKELEDITRAYDGMKGIMPEGCPIVIADKEYFDSGRLTERYISKDKIKAKIKEIQMLDKKGIGFNYNDNQVLDLLQELLGDE